ncbi:DUF4288 domain-containing protein [Chroococcidiopsis sp. FACHB-1243]|uniref:DUF4288 domain-containing protein n=1 Tax=Chroococcidiopsis sp. [FACHB-1243] TaxID=2692781 RepID=UPI0017868D75|nr:DUF4288 domain-containing protein [Chroococcidiopsis sp. [FACHB-1243]]MBD2308167.1 DUF4288 domain-containing protein [Chroococcidiopsis sp. [FACHB-1243]]
MTVDRDIKEASFYIAVVLFESSSSAPNNRPLYEECFILIQANSLEEAREKALLYSRQQGCSYQNQYNDTITWTCKQIIDVNSVLYDDFSDVTEIYARHFRNYEAYCQFEPYLSSEEL